MNILLLEVNWSKQSWYENSDQLCQQPFPTRMQYLRCQGKLGTDLREPSLEKSHLVSETQQQGKEMSLMREWVGVLVEQGQQLVVVHRETRSRTLL